MDDIKVLKQTKLITCSCGHIIKLDDNVTYNVIKEDKEKALVEISCVCQKCNQPKNIKCAFVLLKTRQVADYKDEKVLKAKSTKKPGEYEIYTDTKKVVSGSHTEIEYSNTVKGAVEYLFNRKDCRVREMDE